MPPAEIGAVLRAAPADREAGIAAHLERLHRSLMETATAVASLHALMAGPPIPPVQFRDLPAQPAISTSAAIGRDEIGAWCAEVYPRLFTEAGRLGARPTGPGAALYSPGWFENDGGEVTAYVPVVSGPATVEGGRYAVALHVGAFEQLDLTYGLLGRHVIDRGLGADGPIREIYLVTPADTDDPAHLRTEICWPVKESTLKS